MRLTSLDSFGWTTALEDAFRPHDHGGRCAGRIVSQQRGLVKVVTNHGVLQSDAAGRLLHDVAQENRPVIGDWVVCEPRVSEQSATITAVLPRKSCFTRKQAGRRVHAQAVAANIDIAFLVMAMGADFNASRLERYLALTHESGARPVVLLTKSDISTNADEIHATVARHAPDTQAITVSSRLGTGLEPVADILTPGTTGVLLGSSGAGKSTLLNALLQRDHARTGAVSDHDEKGRHTTSHRELVRLPWGGLLIDTPGMRELGMVSAMETLATTFGPLGEQITELASDCRFRDCHHEDEPGCAVRAALHDGSLDTQAWETWRKLTEEVAELERRHTPQGRSDSRSNPGGRRTRKDHQRSNPGRNRRH